MRVQVARAANDLLVLRVPSGDLDLHGDRLVRLARDHAALPGLATRGATVRRGGARAGLVLRAALRPVGGAPACGLLAALAPCGSPLLRALLRARLARLARALQATACLPVETFEGVVGSLSGGVLGVGGCGGVNLLRRCLLGSGLPRLSFLSLRLLLRSLL